MPRNKSGGMRTQFHVLRWWNAPGHDYPAASVGLPQRKQGRVRALAFTGAQRLATLPDVPTIAEAGVPEYFADAGWRGVFALTSIATQK